MYERPDRKTTTTTRIMPMIARMSGKILLRVRFGGFGGGGDGGNGDEINGCDGRRNDESS